ncbi:V-type proton ATPase subunit C [Trichomonascus vanleenenianus]|uniref:H(+)-transporting V1 sector ATPase subunit C n=1 Tax=Trichomonascus vanleenenianus TaxID=2268995 RepID=UPI003ECAD311
MPSQLDVPSVLLVSLPYSAAPSGGDPQTQLEKWYTENLGVSHGDISTFEIPNFKIGTLDNLVQQSEELAKLDNQFHGMVSKAAEIILSIYDGNKSHTAAAKRVKDKSALEYLETFTWNTGKYRVDRPIPELVDLLSKETAALDSDVRNSFNSYNAAKSNLSAVDRKQTGNLSVRSLHDIVKREHFVQDSEYLQTVLVAVPKPSKKEYLQAYETLAPMVVPRSASLIAEDSEFALYNTTLFKKYVPEFLTQVREHRWVPREFKYSEELISDLRKERQVASQTERKLFGEIARLAATAYEDMIQAWAHLKALRVFVESVLRYGLPPNFLTNTIRPPTGKSIDKCEAALVQKFGYLGGNAFEKDKKGKIKGDTDLSEYGALVDMEYKPFVIYRLDIL